MGGRLEEVRVGPAADEVVVREVRDRPHGGVGDLVVVEVLLGDTLDLIGRDHVDAHEDLGGRHAAREDEDLAADVLADGRRAIELHQDRGLELIARTLDLLLRDAAREAHELGDERVDKVLALALLRGAVDAEQARVLVRRVEGRERVAQALVRHQLRQPRHQIVAPAHRLPASSQTCR